MSRLGLLPLLFCVGCTQTESLDTRHSDAKAESDVKPSVCTVAACFDTATIVTKLGPSSATLGKHEFALKIDGEAISCSVEFADIAQVAFAACVGDKTVFLTIGPAMTSKEEKVGDGVTVTMVPVPGEFVWELRVVGRPAEIHVAHTGAGTTLVDRSTRFVLYEDFRPNGEGCPPVCKRARVDWEVP